MSNKHINNLTIIIWNNKIIYQIIFIWMIKISKLKDNNNNLHNIIIIIIIMLKAI